MISPVSHQQLFSLRSAGAQLQDDPRWKLAVRVAESHIFASSPSLSRMLLFLCSRTLLNSVEDLTERNIGVAVFQRRPDYKTSEDNIVRSYVRQLRTRMERYFEEYADKERLRIVIPRGGYGVVFEEQEQADQLAMQKGEDKGLAEQTETESATRPESRRKTWLPGLMFLAGLITGTWGALWIPRLFVPKSQAHTLWSEIFKPGAKTLIVTADSALATVEELSGKHATLENYINGSYFAQFNAANTEDEHKIYVLSREHLTGSPDLAAVSDILCLPEARGRDVTVRNARALTMDDMKDANVIMLGSAFSTPWVALFEPKMNFRFAFDGSVYDSYVKNMKPGSGELAEYHKSTATTPHSTYAVVAYLPNLNNAGRVLLVEGLTTAGTEAAASLLMDGHFEGFLKTVPRDKQGLRPFEVLLRTTDVDSSASAAEIVAKRTY